MQRISAFGRLSPLALNETQAYIDHRLATAGYQGAHLFTHGAVRDIWEHSRGVPRNINTLCFNAMLFAFAEHARSIDSRIVEEAARDLDLNSVLADLYQMDSARPGSHGKILPIRETSLPETGGAGVTTQPAAAQGGILMDAGALASAGPSSNRNPASGVEQIPAAPAAGNVTPALEEKKIPPVEKPAPSAETQPAAGPLPVPQEMIAAAPVQGSETPGKAGQLRASAITQGVPAAAIPSNKAANPGKNAPPKKVETPVQPQREAALAKTSLNKQQAAQKRSESRIWWAKAIALTATTGLLAFVLGQQFLTHRPGQVEANGSGVSGPAQSSSAATNDGAGPGTDTPGAQSKTTSADSRRLRNADSSDTNDVTVRKFPTNSDDAWGTNQKLATIFFDQDSAVISSDYGSFLHRVADALAENPGATAILEGHTDNTGPESYNQELSSRRAIEVRNALIDQLHVPTSRLTAVGAGAADPAQPNSSAAGRAYNRRVEIRLVHLGE